MVQSRGAKEVDISSNGLFFYQVTLFAFIAIIGAAEKLRFRDWDHFCSKQLKHFVFKYVFSAIPVFLVLLFFFENWLKSLAFALVIPLILTPYKTSSRRKEQRKIEDLLSILTIVFVYIFIAGLVVGKNFSLEASVSAIVSFLISIAIGVLFGIAAQAIQRQHILIMLTFSTAAFIISDSLTKLGLISAICFVLLYYNLGVEKKVKQDILLYFFKGVITLSLVVLVIENFSLIALLIAFFIILIKVIFGHKHFSYSLLPLAVAVGFDKMFYETAQYVNVVCQVTFFVAVISIVFNFQDIFFRLKKLVLAK